MSAARAYGWTRPPTVVVMIAWFALHGWCADVAIRDFGAIPGDGVGDADQIEKAIDACQPGDRLLFENGQYDLWKTITIRHKQSLNVDGHGAVLMLRGFNRDTGGPTFSALRLVSSRHVTIHDFSVNMDVSPNTAGEIVDVNDGFFDVRVFDEFPVSGREQMDRMMTFHCDGRPNGRNFDLIGSVVTVEKRSDRVLRIHSNQAHHLSPGEYLCMYHKVYGGVAIYFGDTTNCTLRDVTINAVAGMAFTASDRSVNVTLERMRVEPPAGSRRLASSNADGSKFVLTGGLLTIKDCTFEGMGDDAINVHSSFGQVAELDSSKNALSMRPARGEGQVSSRYVLPGDRLEFYDSKTLLPKGVARAVQRSGDHIELDTVPNGVRVGDLLNNLTMSPQVRISGVTVRRNRARGFLLQSQDVMVENCEIVDPTGVGIFVTTDVTRWYESGPGRNIIIRNNTIRGANRHLQMEGAINIKCGHDAGGTDFPAGVHRQIRIEGNTLQDTAGSGIYVCSTEGVVVTENVLEHCSLAPEMPSGQYAVFLKNCRDIRVERNVITRSDLTYGAVNCEQLEGLPFWKPPLRSPFEIAAIQAEDWTAQDGCSTVAPSETNEEGFLLLDRRNTFARWNTIAVPHAGTYEFSIRYSNPADTGQSCTLIVNGVTVRTLDFLPARNDRGWRTLTIPLALRGGNNDLTLTATTDRGEVRLDRFELSEPVTKGTVR